MKTEEAIRYFGSVKRLASVLDVWPNTIYGWGELIPKKHACYLEVVTKGRLKAKLEEYGDPMAADLTKCED